MFHIVVPVWNDQGVAIRRLNFHGGHFMGTRWSPGVWSWSREDHERSKWSPGGLNLGSGWSTEGQIMVRGSISRSGEGHEGSNLGQDSLQGVKSWSWGSKSWFRPSGDHVRGSNSGPGGQISILGGSKIISPGGHFDMRFWSDFGEFWPPDGFSMGPDLAI